MIEFNFLTSSLNPYSTGSNSNSLKALGVALLEGVLILILLEVTQINNSAWPRRSKINVLILILLEVTQIPQGGQRGRVDKRASLNPYSTGSNSNTKSIKRHGAFLS